MNERLLLFRVSIVGALLVASACGDGPEGALSLPGPDGGDTVAQALAEGTSGSWVRGFFVAYAGEPVLLCGALTESYPPRCAGASVILRDGVIWREPAEDTVVIGGVVDGELSVSGLPCGFSSDGPCSAYPGMVASGDALWSEVEYSVLGMLDRGGLGPRQCPPGADC